MGKHHAGDPSSRRPSRWHTLVHPEVGGGGNVTQDKPQRARRHSATKPGRGGARAGLQAPGGGRRPADIRLAAMCRWAAADASIQLLPGHRAGSEKAEPCFLPLLLLLGLWGAGRAGRRPDPPAAGMVPGGLGGPGAPGLGGLGGWGPGSGLFGGAPAWGAGPMAAPGGGWYGSGGWARIPRGPGAWGGLGGGMGFPLWF